MARSHNILYHDASGKVGEMVIAQIAGQATIKKWAFRNRSQSAAQMQQTTLAAAGTDGDVRLKAA